MRRDTPNKTRWGHEDEKKYIRELGTGRYRENGGQRLSRTQLLRNWIKTARVRSWQESKSVRLHLVELIKFARAEIVRETEIRKRIIAG